MLARQVDIGVIQQVSVADLFRLAEQLERAPEEALVQLRHSLAAFREEQRAAEKGMMSNDRKLIFTPPVPASLPETPVLNHVLLTGGTGFIGGYVTRELVDLGRHLLDLLQAEEGHDLGLDDEDRDRAEEERLLRPRR